MDSSRLPLLPLLLDNVPPALAAALSTEGVPMEAHDPQRPRARFVLFDGDRRRPTLCPGQTPIDVAPLRKLAEDDPLRLLETIGTAPHAWQVGPWRVTEDVSCVHRQRLRQVIVAAVRQLVEQAGGVWMRFAPYPFPYRSAFNLRFDHDAYIEADFQAMLARTDRWRDACSHFLLGSAFEKQPEALAKLKGYDVGSHGYYHHTYRNQRDNHGNIARGIEALVKNGLKPAGFVAPHGRYGKGLAKAMESLHIRYSSEFGLAYDDFPFRPVDSRVWQLPVHPVSLGIVLDAADQQGVGPSREEIRKRAASDLADYWCQLIRTRNHSGDPIFLYCHPDGRLGRYPEVLDRVFETVGNCSGLWPVTMTRWLDWWQFRRGAKLQLHRRGEEMVMIVDGHLGPWRLAVEFWRGDRVALMPLDNPVVRFTQQTLAFERRRSARVAVPDPVRQSWSWRSFLRKQIDWERVTPAEQIRDPSWRGWTKWVLKNMVNNPVVNTNDPGSTLILPRDEQNIPDHQRIDEAEPGVPPPNGSSIADKKSARPKKS
jgi:peptidoglycan/xylan/chitin deacetylase (PgdA/CDA1 family)